MGALPRYQLTMTIDFYVGRDGETVNIEGSQGGALMDLYKAHPNIGTREVLLAYLEFHTGERVQLFNKETLLDYVAEAVDRMYRDKELLNAPS